MTNKTMVVSDIDDTIKWSHILGTTLELLESGLNHRLAFKGMPELYTSLAKSGAKFSYVTGAPDILIGHVEADSLPRKVISTNNFPDAVPYMHKLGKSTEEFKVATITQIMKDDPDCDFILIGDNGERDVDTYSRIRHDPEIGGRVKQVFIHRLYNGGRSLDPMADQLPFLTAADLAAMLYGFNFITADDLATVVKIVNDGMNDKNQDRNQKHDLTLPFAAQLVPGQVDAIYGALPKTIDAQTQELLDDIHNLILEQANQEPRR